MTTTSTSFGLDQLLREGDALIIVPPFAGIDRPSLAAHVLQACAATHGIRVRVLYANLLLADAIGVATYQAISDGPPHAMLGERFFARAAHGLPPLGEPTHSKLDWLTLCCAKPRAATTREQEQGVSARDGFSLRAPAGLDIDQVTRLEPLAGPWADEVAAAVTRLPFVVVGATTTFEQTNASLALLRRIKHGRKGIVTILGGANCEGEMAEGIASMNAAIDHIFSGESEVAFPAFMRDLLAGKRPAGGIVRGAPCPDLESLPTPDFTEYFEQRARLLTEHRGASAAMSTLLPYESSRGCWWGQKHHCTFCGLNGTGMVFREKSAERVIRDLRALAEAHGTKQFCMTDNIMPHSYFKTLLPMLANEGAPVEIFYEQKANLGLDDVLALKAAGVSSIQPGIEALSSALLRRMNKGVRGRQNVTLLRYSRTVGLDVRWNLLWGFPDDEPEAYEETLALIPRLWHLQPPTGLSHLSIDRFSPYFSRSEAHGIRNLRPHPAYGRAFPPHTDLAKVAYRFVGDYACGAHRRMDVIAALEHAVEEWRSRWLVPDGVRPALRLNSVGDYYVIRDTRGLRGTQTALVLDRAEAIDMLTARPHTEATSRWIEQDLGVLLDGWYVPLATAPPGVLTELEQQGREDSPASRKGGARARRGSLTVIP